MSDFIDIPLGNTDYFRLAAANPSVATRNVYFENDPTNTEKGTTLIRRPGLKRLLSVGLGPIRKIYYRPDVFSNRFFVVSGTEFYSILRTDDDTFAQLNLPVVLSLTDTVDITASATTLFVTDKANLYQTDGVTALSVIATPDDVPINKVAYIAGYVICVVNDSQRFYWIKPGASTIDPLDFAEAEGLPDGIVDVVVLGDQIYFLGKETIEVWYLSGDVDAPFQRIQGKLLNIGTLANTASVVNSNDSFFFIAADGTARMGPSMEKISNPGVEERFRRAIAAQHLASI